MLARQILLFSIAFCSTMLLFSQNPISNFATSVQGYAYVDMNSNEVFDQGDAPLKHVEIIAECENSIIHTTTNHRGLYSLQLPSTDCFVRIAFKNKSVSIYPFEYDLSGYGTSDEMRIDGINFRIVPKEGLQNDKKISIRALSTIESGGQARFELKIENGVGYTKKDFVLLAIEKPFSFHHSKPTHSLQSKKGIAWEVPALEPFEIWTVHLYLDVGSNPSNLNHEVGQSATLSASLPTQNGELQEEIHYQITNSSGIENDEIKNNSKTIIGNVALTPDDVKKGVEVLYFIRFQNIFNEIVGNLVISDTMDSRLNGSSFEMVSASHPYQIIRDDNNLVRWIFNEINLPDTTISPEDSQGYILFKVRVKENLFPGDFVLNRATISFDTLSDLITNPAVFSIRENAGIFPNYEQGKLKVFPNPTARKCTIQIPNQKGTLQLSLCDLQGKVLYKQTLKEGSEHTIDLPSITSGIYLLYIMGEGGSTVQKLIIK